MDPKEIFELIIKADEKVKYSNEANMDLRKQQAIDLLTQARDAAKDAGNDALGPAGGDAADGPRGYAVAQPRKASSRMSRCAGESCSSESRPVIAIV